VLWKAGFHAVGDERWRNWVEAAIDRATGVIVDVTAATESVRWELETALRAGPEKVLVLYDGHRPGGLPATTAAFDGAPGLPREAAAFIARWASDLMRTASQAEVKPRPSRVRRQFPSLISLPPAATVAGIVFATAIPAGLTYMKKSKNSEAHEHLKKIAEGAKSYYLESGALPASVATTPSLGSCCEGGGKCAPDLAMWDQPTWRALGFSMDDPHYYRYEFQSDGDRFTARAIGDLDCDSNFATFRIYGQVDSQGIVDVESETPSDPLE
jgi:hypothetical protein